ncbi:rhodanese-like domain-containing protein [Ferrimonas balearica]|uniref:rhodanese-like domain-containing protein n=1 Tax=Ferrimonas balearica TaxID=44012 RepID=UPI001C99AA7C|nr:rhodanese-like domain-containing protein [Ferrimonas balearica]MBY5993395.1 rhodanese-like domain-containing protein [Ferrimonas balearica]
MQEYFDFFARNPILSLVWVALLGMFIMTLVKSKLSKFKTVSHQQATLLINRQDAKILDVRGADEFKKGHIVDAINVPLSQIKNNQLGAVEKHKNDPIIVVCNAGISSSQAAQVLVKAGFEQVYNLHGGMTDWNAANLPVVRKKKR